MGRTLLTVRRRFPKGPARIASRAHFAKGSFGADAPSSNGKTTDSDSVNRGSNPRGASNLSFAIIRPSSPKQRDSFRLLLLFFASNRCGSLKAALWCGSK